MLCFTLYSRANSKYKPPGGAYIRRGDLTEGFLRYDFWGFAVAAPVLVFVDLAVRPVVAVVW